MAIGKLTLFLESVEVVIGVFVGKDINKGGEEWIIGLAGDLLA